MPTANTTTDETCDGTWNAVAGPGEVYIHNPTRRAVEWNIGGAAPSEAQGGFPLPATGDSGSLPIRLEVQSGSVLYVRGPDGAPFRIYVAAVPA